MREKYYRVKLTKPDPIMNVYNGKVGRCINQSAPAFSHGYIALTFDGIVGRFMFRDSELEVCRKPKPETPNESTTDPDPTTPT